MTHGRVFCFRWKARVLNKLYKNFSVAVVFQNELINYIPFGLDIKAWHTPEETKSHLPSHKAFPRYFFTDILHYSQYKIKLKANSSVIKLFKETVHLPKLFEMHLLTFLIFPISQKKSREFLHDPLCFMTLSYAPSACVSIRNSAFWDPENIGPKYILFYSTKKRETFFFSWSLRDYIQ